MKSTVKYSLTFTLLFSLTFISCKKSEERDLIKDYEGIYNVTHIDQTLENLQIATTEEKIELEVKKSCKGIKIRGVEGIDNFKLNYKDSTFTEEDGETTAHGKLFPNDSITLTISYSFKLPFADIYHMKKK